MATFPVSPANGDLFTRDDTTFVYDSASGVWKTSSLSIVGDLLHMPDGKPINIGTGNDLQLIHNGSNSFITDNGTGSLYIDSSRTIMRVSNQTTIDATTGSVNLYANNSIKLSTSATGTTIKNKILLSNAESLLAWDSNRSVIQLSAESAISESENTNGLGLTLSRNSVFNGTNWISVGGLPAPMYRLTPNGEHQFSIAASPTSGQSINHTLALHIDESGVVHINGNIFGSGQLNVKHDATQYGQGIHVLQTNAGVTGTNARSALHLETTGAGDTGIWLENPTYSTQLYQDANGVFNLAAGTGSLWSIQTDQSRNVAVGNNLTVTGDVTINGGQLTMSSANTRDKLRVWNSGTYAIGMQSGYTFGALNDYAMTFQMSNTNARGFWWGDSTHTNAQGAMSLTTTGLLTVAGGLKIGYGEADTSGPLANSLNVSGDAMISGDITAATGTINDLVSDTITVQTLTVGGSATIDATISSAEKWKTARTITLAGDLSGSVSIDGSANVTLSAQVANDSHTHSNYVTSNADDIKTGDLEFQTAAITYSQPSIVPGVHVLRPAGGQWTCNTSVVTGYLKIGLPVTWTNTMMRMTVDIYDYAADESVTLYVGGYNYATNQTWNNTFAQVISSRTDKFYTVRFGVDVDGTTCAIYIGEPTSTWSYPQVTVRDFFAGYSAATAANWADDWYIEFQTTAGAITATETASLISSASLKWATSRTLTLTGDVAGNISFDGTANVTMTTAVANDSHTHNFTNLTNKTAGTGEYSTNGALVAGRGSGGVAMTVNDGYGNANLTFNHKSGVPEQTGNAARIVVNTDTTSNANMNFQVGSGVTSGVASSLSSVLTLYETKAVTATNFEPSTNNTLMLGSSAGRWNTVYATVFDGTATTARYADLAEMYKADQPYTPGTVLVFGGEAEVTTTDKKGDRRIAGVVSTNPAYLMNNSLKDGTPVALQGRVPCKVVGRVTKGDLLVSSPVAGYATVDNDPKIGAVIGKALENKNTTEKGTIEIVVGRV